MQVVATIPLWLYAIIVFVAIYFALTVLLIVGAIYFIYLFIKDPLQAISILILIGIFWLVSTLLPLAFEHWFISLVAIIMISVYWKKIKKFFISGIAKKEEEPKLLSYDEPDEINSQDQK